MVQARCVIITSGTLSPMDAFEGELGVPFPLKLEAPHIIPERQLFVHAEGECAYERATGRELFAVVLLFSWM